jgi:hypothetical protein
MKKIHDLAIADLFHRKLQKMGVGFWLLINHFYIIEEPDSWRWAK